MDLSSLPQELTESHIGLAGGALLLLTLVVGFIKGIIRISLSIVGFAAAAFIFWIIFRNGGALVYTFIDSPDPWLPFGIACGAAVIVYSVIRHGLGFMLKPIIGSLDLLKSKRIYAGLIACGLCFTALWGGGSASHQLDTMHFLKNQSDGKVSLGWLNQILLKSQESWFGQFQESTDPTRTALRCDLIKLLTLSYSGEVLEIPSLAHLHEILLDKDFQSLLLDPDLNQYLKARDFQSLFKHEKVKNFLKDDQNRNLIELVDWREVYHNYTPTAQDSE